MIINTLWPWELKEKSEGTAVVCDFWAATTNITTFLAKGVKKLYIVNGQNYLEVKQKYPEALIIGESKTLPLSTFDASNYPHNIAPLNLKDKTVIFMTANGSRIIELALQKGFQQVITVSFTNIESVSHYLKSLKNTQITLIPSGDTTDRVVEDIICVQTLKDLVEGNIIDWENRINKMKKFILSYYHSDNFKEDFEIVFDVSRFNIVPSCKKSKNQLIEITDLITQNPAYTP